MSPSVSLFCRRLQYCTIVAACAAVAVRAVALESFEVASGSMAPALRGPHRTCTCPGCGQEVAVGLSRHDRKAFCGSCGQTPLPLGASIELPGSRVLVNKVAFHYRRPERWEIVVFRLLGTFYIKRLLGLPGESIQIHDGDVYVDGRIARKTFAQAKAMRIPLGEGSRDPVVLDGRSSPADFVFSPAPGKCEPIRDEYDYNAGLHADSECVHDFSVEADLEVHTGAGAVTLWLDDGHGRAEFVLPVRAGMRQRIEMAFVDRRLSVTVDGRLRHSEDWPEAKSRAGVEHPFGVRADGVGVSLHGLRVYRDVHYGQQGRHGVRGKSAPMGVDQYFVLGDNSPCSEDSRFWADPVRAESLVGPVLRP